MVFTDQGVVYDQYEGVPQDGGLGQLVRQDGDEGTDGLGHAHHGGQGQHRVRCPAQDEGAGQEQDLHRGELENYEFSYSIDTIRDTE